MTPSEMLDEIKTHRPLIHRLIAAERILADLSTGHWIHVLNENDAPVKKKMGQRVIEYWKTYSV